MIDQHVTDATFQQEVLELKEAIVIGTIRDRLLTRWASQASDE